MFFRFFVGFTNGWIKVLSFGLKKTKACYLVTCRRYCKLAQVVKLNDVSEIPEEEKTYVQKYSFI